MPSFETAARSLKVVSITAPVHDDVEIETAIAALGREPGGGLVVLGSFMLAHPAPIISATTFVEAHLFGNLDKAHWFAVLTTVHRIQSLYSGAGGYRRASCVVSSHSRRAAPSSRALRLGTASWQSTK